MIGMGITEIEKLGQEEGFNDQEVATMLGVHRTTITRIRLTHNIPKCDTLARKDKVVTCKKCGSKFVIRRGQIRSYCYTCVPLEDGKDTIIKETTAWMKKKSKN